MNNEESIKNVIYLVYDDECILCKHTAKALKLRKAVGALELINARSSHPLVLELQEKGFDLNEGIIVKYQDKLYYAKDALNLLAFLSGPYDMFNRFNAFLFKSKIMTSLSYPVFKAIRNCLLFFRGIPIIKKQDKKIIFAAVFAEKWDEMPVVFKKRYGNLAFQDTNVMMQGAMNVVVSRYFAFLAPFLKLSGSLVPYPGENIPVTITLKSSSKNDIVYMNRTFYYPNKKPYRFNSSLLITKNNQVLELMRFGIGIKMIYSYEANKVYLKQVGYTWRLFGLNIPLPLTFILGKVAAAEEAISDNHFKMYMTITHPIFKEIFSYEGEFELRFAEF